MARLMNWLFLLVLVSLFLMAAIEEGPPSAKDLLPPSIQPYFNILGDLTIIDDVVCYGDRLVIPQSLRQQCLQALHAAHQGT